MTRQERLKALGDAAQARLTERRAQSSSVPSRYHPERLGHFADDAPELHRAFAQGPASQTAAQTAARTTAVSAEETGLRRVDKRQLVDVVAQQASLTKKQSEQAVSALLEIVVMAIRGGQSVGLPGLGTLSVKPTAARTGVKPGTGEKFQIPAGKKVAFTPARTLKGDL